MNPSPQRHRRTGCRKVASLITGVTLGALLCHARIVCADPIADSAAHMSAQSFALLATLNGESVGGSANPLLGPVASFASDTEILKRALASGDPAGQATAVNTLASDCAVIDAGLKTNPKALQADDWQTIRGELDRIARAVARSTAGRITSAPPPRATSAIISATAPDVVSAAPTVPPVRTAASILPPLAPVVPPSNPTEGAPVVKIESRTISGDVVRIKGYIEGTALKSAGIYQNGQPLRTFQVSDVPGEQKIDLDIGIASPPPGAMLRVVDANGRFAEAPVTATVAALPLPADAPPARGMPDGPVASNEGGVEVFRDTPTRGSAAAAGDDQSEVKEIPSLGAPAPAAPSVPSPSRRHTLGGHLANVAISVLGVTQTASAPPSYEVVGQIAGPGVTRAGIYVDGRLSKSLPVEAGDDFTNFDERFVMNGNAATVRAYGAGNQFTESAVDLANGLASTQPLPSGPFAYAGHPSAPGIGVLITSVNPGAGNVYTVAGTLSGPNIASAGLYQNGVLAQAITVGGGLGGTLGGALGGSGGLGSMLGNLLPGTAQSTNFNLRFNPGAGYASIRAYDRTGNYTEQPIMAGGVNPYGAANPYGGMNPYGANRAVNPYGTGTNPYGGTTTNPYFIGAPGSPSTRPLW